METSCGTKYDYNKGLSTGTHGKNVFRTHQSDKETTQAHLNRENV